MVLAKKCLITFIYVLRIFLVSNINSICIKASLSDNKHSFLPIALIVRPEVVNSNSIAGYFCAAKEKISITLMPTDCNFWIVHENTHLTQISVGLHEVLTRQSGTECGFCFQWKPSQSYHVTNCHFNVCYWSFYFPDYGVLPISRNLSHKGVNVGNIEFVSKFPLNCRLYHYHIYAILTLFSRGNKLNHDLNPSCAYTVHVCLWRGRLLIICQTKHQPLSIQTLTSLHLF